MTSVDINYFDILSNELIAEVVNFLDLVSLFRLSCTCKQLCAFKNISNEQWRRYYAQKWFLEDKELAIYPNHNWQQLYQDRLKSENEYLLWVKNAASTQNQADQVQETTSRTEEDAYTAILADVKKTYRVTTADASKPDTYYDTLVDPWAILIQANSQKINPPTAVIRACLRSIDEFFYSPFTHRDQLREVESGRFGIAVTTIAKYAADDITILTELTLFKFFFSDDFKNTRRKIPIGLLGLLSKYLDLTLPLDVLMVVTQRLWEAAGAKTVEDEFFVGLEIIPKTINVLLKSTDNEIKRNCMFILTWFSPTKPEHRKLLVNAPFMHYLIGELDEAPAEEVRWILQLLTTFGECNGSVVNETRLVHLLMNFIRGKYHNDHVVLPYLLNAVSDLCLDNSTNCCTELAQSESDLEYLLSLVKHSALNEVKKVSQCALNAIDTVARNEIGAERLLELNALDKLVPLIEDTTNAYLFKELYYTLKYMTSFGNKNGLGDEIFPKLLKFKDALFDRGYASDSDFIRAACDEFWMTFSCMTTPPRDVSIRIIDRVMPLIIEEKTRLRTRLDAAILLANLIEIDIGLFEGKQIVPLFSYLAEYLINFDPEKEDATLRKQWKEEDKKMKNVNNEEEEEDDEDDENEEAEELIFECPWPLNLLSQLARFDYIQNSMIHHERLIQKLFSLDEDESLEFEGRFMVAYIFSFLVGIPGWDSAKALECIEEFALDAEYDVEWNFVLAAVEPYVHLVRKENPLPLIIFGSWFLAHMSTLESGRQTLKKDLDPEVVTWMKTYPHPRVQHNMTHFTRNMQKKSRRKQ